MAAIAKRNTVATSRTKHTHGKNPRGEKKILGVKRPGGEGTNNPGVAPF